MNKVKITKEQIVEMATKQEKNRIKETFSSIIRGVDDRVIKIIDLSIDKGVAFSRKINAKDDTEQYDYQALEEKYISEIFPAFTNGFVFVKSLVAPRLVVIDYLKGLL